MGKDDDSRRSCSAEDDDLQIRDGFNGSNRSLNRSSHESTQDKLIRQFNSSVGLESLERSVASFYLEMCDNDLRMAVDFFKEQNKATAKPYPSPPRPQEVPPKRMHSFDTIYRQ